MENCIAMAPFDEENVVVNITSAPAFDAPAREASTPDNPASSRISAKKLRGKSRTKKSGDGESTTSDGRLQTKLQVRMPQPQWYYRCHPDPAMTVPVDILVIEGGAHEGLYFIAPDVDFPDQLFHYVKEALITRSITSDNTEFFLLAKQSAKSPKESTRRVVAEARRRWIRTTWNPTSMSYDIFPARNLQRDPVWPDTPLDDLLEKAFGDNYIDRADHPVVNRLLFPDDDDC
jgi:hypothetical protein